MSSCPWMPLYIADYLGDTGDLSTIEHGAYMLLIMHYWLNRGLPDDDRRLARIARLQDAEWAQMRDTIAVRFVDGWHHKRIDIELAKADATVTRRSAAGKAAASARYANRMPDAEQSQLPRGRASPSPSPSERVAAQPLARAAENPDIGKAITATTSAEPSASIAIPVALLRGERDQAWIDQVEAESREAAGLVGDPSPGLADISPIVTLIAAGFDFTKDIVPALRAAKAANKRGRTWRYYVAGITEGKSRNGAIQPKAASASAKPMAWVLHESPEWEPTRTAYRAAHGKDPPRIAGLGGMGWHFPPEMVPVVNHEMKEAS